MSNVSEFPQRTVQGLARCTACRHEWQAVVPFDLRFESLECSACDRVMGVMINHYAPIGETVWQCGCGNDIFYLVVAGNRYAFYCINCGDSTEFP